MLTRTWVLAALGFAMVFASDLASAQEMGDQERARQHFAAGRSYYEQGRYEDAAREFREAYRLSERAHLLKNVAIALERAQEYREAGEALEEYLQHFPEAKDRRTIEIRITELRKLADATGKLAIANEPSPSDKQAVPAVVAEEEREKPRGYQTTGIVFLGAGGGAAAGALVTGLVAHSIFSDLEADCPGGLCPEGRRDDKNKGQTLAVVSTVLTGVAIAGLTAGVVLLLVGKKPTQESSASSRVAVESGPGDVGAAFSVRF